MKFTSEAEVVGELQSALCLSMEAIREAANLGAISPNGVAHQKSWTIAGREYCAAVDHLETVWRASVNQPLWLAECFASDSASQAAVERWVSVSGDKDDVIFSFPALSESGQFGFRMMFFTENQEAASLFRMFH